MAVVAVLIVGLSTLAVVYLLFRAGGDIASDLLITSNVRRMRGVSVRNPLGEPAATPPTLAEATAQLIQYAKEVRPEWLLGVNYGGHMLASHIAAQIKLPGQYVGTIQAIGTEPLELIASEPRNYISGSVLIIDDILRTGATLERIRQYILRSNAIGHFYFSDITMATLYVADGVEDSLRVAPHWYCAKVRGNGHTFPWTRASAELKEAWPKRDAASAKVLSDWRALLRDQGLSRSRASAFLELTPS